MDGGAASFLGGGLCLDPGSEASHAGLTRSAASSSYGGYGPASRAV